MNFASDNVYGVHPAILQALSDANSGTAPSYGYDDLTRQAEDELSRVFERDVKAFLVTTGTAANGLALSAITPPHGAVLCHGEAHIAVDECNAPELFTGGAKIIGHNGPAGKITPAILERTIRNFIRGEHDPKPASVSITNATELGTVYSPAEVRDIAGFAHAKNMKLHVDGARFANAVVSTGCTPAELTWKAGVDVMSFGATKNGAMVLEAVVFFDTHLAEDFLYRRMRAGQLLSKGRYLAAQMLAYLKDDLWLDNARRANALAQRVSEGLSKMDNLRIAVPTQANEVFVIMPRETYAAWQKAGVRFHDWIAEGSGIQVPESSILARLVLSFATPDSDVDDFLDLAASKSG
jgi:threonine aldolase